MKCDSYQLNHLQVKFTDLQNKELINLRTKSIQEALKLNKYSNDWISYIWINCIHISGNATPYKDSLDCVGVCHLGVSIRGKDGIHTKVKSSKKATKVKKKVLNE